MVRMRNKAVVLLCVIAALAAGCSGGGTGAGSVARAGSGDLRVLLDEGTGLLSGIESGPVRRPRSWLSAPMALSVRDEASGRGVGLAPVKVRPVEGGATAESLPGADPAAMSWSYRLRVGAARAEWSLSFASNSPRTGHQVSIDLPILSPGARIFTPSQLGVVDVDAYPSFRPVPYANYDWDGGQGYVLPLVTVMDPASDRALTVALPPDEAIPHLQVEWTGGRVLRLVLGHRGIGGGRASALRLLVYAHPADYRSALAAYAGDFPAWFRPVLPRGPFEGAFWYHHVLDHPDFDEMARQGVRYLWSSFWFTHMGEFLPDARTWYPYTYSRWWNLKRGMSDRAINSVIATLHGRGLGLFAYFNVTEFGGRGGRSGGTEESDRVIRETLSGALVRDAEGKPIKTWENSWVVNPRRDHGYGPMLEDQARRHVERLPGLDGFIVDRLDWASRLDYAHDDGLSMAGSRPVENIAGPAAEAMAALTKISHAAGKRVLANQFWRVEVVRDVDGYCHENDYLPALGYLSPFRPAAAWHIRRGYRGDDLLAFESQVKRRLRWALFPQFIAHEFRVSQQDPEPRAADMMEVFAPLFEPLAGKDQVLSPHCVAVTGPNDANLFVDGSGVFAAPVTSRVRFLSRPAAATERVELTLRAPGAAGIEWAHVYSADGPPYRAGIRIREGSTRVALERHGSSSVVVAGNGPEPPLRDDGAARLAALRTKVFGPAAAPPSGAPAERPRIEGPVETELRVSGVDASVSGRGPTVALLFDGRKVAEVADRGASTGVLKPAATTTVRVALPAAALPADAPSVSFTSGDEGSWFIPDRVEWIARTPAGGVVLASWRPGDPCGAEGRNGFRLPLTWRASGSSVYTFPPRSFTIIRFE